MMKNSAEIAREMNKQGEELSSKNTQDQSTKHQQGIGSDEKKASSSLFEEHWFTKEIIDSIGEGIIVYDKEIRYRLWNPVMEKLTGYPEKEILGKKASEIFPEILSSGVLNRIEKALHGETISSGPQRLNTVNNDQEKWVDGTYAPHRNHSGEIIGVIAMIQDITLDVKIKNDHIKRSELLLTRHSILMELTKINALEPEAYFQKLTERACLGMEVERASIWLLQEGEMSMQCQDLFILSSGIHETGEIIHAHIYPRYFLALDEHRSIIAPDARSDPRTSEFFENYQKPLNIYSFLDTPVRSEGKLAGVVCFEAVGKQRDWTEDDQDFATSISEILATQLQIYQRKQAEKALMLSEEKYRKIVDNILIGIYRSNIEGKILFANQSMIEMFEFDSMSEAMQFDISKLYFDINTRREFLTQLLGTRVVHNYEMDLQTKNGNVRHVLINAFYEDDSILGMVMDITSRKKAEEDVKNAKVKAEESDRLKTSLLANMSHEFRTPMNAILGFSAVISNESQDPDMVFFARKIHASGERLMATLKAILDLADLEATRSKLKLDQVNVQKAIASAIQPFYSTCNEKNLYLITEFKERLLAWADENLLHVILHNLIDNAVKFTAKGGVTVETDLVKLEEKLWVLIRIKDTGIGIPREHFDIIFHEFRQLSEGYNRSYEGTGLGLTLARKMTEMLNGNITVESEVDLGSIFTLWIPASGSMPESPGEKSESPEDSHTKQFRMHPPENLPLMLVVEDNDDNAEIIKLYLKGKYTTERAPDGYAAVKMAAEKQFSCILMDINLGPGMDGLKATREIRQMDSYTNVPIVAITGYTMSGDREKLLQGGCSHYLGKPFSQQGLNELLEKIFSTNDN